MVGSGERRFGGDRRNWIEGRLAGDLHPTGLNIRHLRLFAQVCEMGSLNRAAADLNVSQPSVSVALAGLEERFGARLLDRYAAGSQPTAAGDVLLARLRRMEEQLASALAQALGASSVRDPALISKATARISFRRIEALIALAASGSITDAARSGGGSPAALHRTLHELQFVDSLFQLPK